MALIQGSSISDPRYANYNPGRPLTASERNIRYNSGALPMSSTTNMNAANYYSGQGGQVQGASTTYRPTSQSVSQPQPAQSSSQPAVSQPDYDAMRREEEARAQQQVEGSFAPAFSHLQTLEADYRQQFPTAQAEIEQSFGAVLPQLTREKETELAGISSQRGAGEQERTSQFSKARQIADELRSGQRQLFNELQQGILARFGGSSSAGLGSSELLGRSVAQNVGKIGSTEQEQMGDISGNFGRFFQDLDKETTRVNSYFQAKLTDLEQQKQLALRGARDTFDSKIREINSKRTELEANKSVARLAALQQLSSEIRAIQGEAQTFQRDLELWRQYKDELLNNAKQFGAKQVDLPGFRNIIGGAQFSLPSAGGRRAAPSLQEQLAQAQGIGLNLTGGKTGSSGLGLTFGAGGGTEDEDLLSILGQ